MTAPHLSWRNLPVRPLKNRLHDADGVVMMRSATMLHRGWDFFLELRRQAILPPDGVDASN